MTDILDGQTIFISASLPSDHRSPEFTVDRERGGWIEDAIIATARAVIERGGRLVLAGNPSIVPLVALVAGEYTPVPHPWQPTSSLDGPPVDVFQSRAHEMYLPSETSAICKAGLVKIYWVESSNDEIFDPSKRGEPQCEASLRVMRETLLTCAKPTAMVGIGGLGDLLEEFEMFSRICSGPVYLYQSTGGAAQTLADKKLHLTRTENRVQAGRTTRSASHPDSSLGMFDRANLQRVHVVEFLAEHQNSVRPSEGGWVEDFIAFRNKRFAHVEDCLREAINPPYGFFANIMVNKIAGIE